MVAVRRQIWEAGTVVVIPFVAAVTGGLLPLLPSRPPASPIPAYQIWERDGRGGGKPRWSLYCRRGRRPPSVAWVAAEGGRGVEGARCRRCAHPPPVALRLHCAPPGWGSTGPARPSLPSWSPPSLWSLSPTPREGGGERDGERRRKELRLVWWELDWEEAGAKFLYREFLSVVGAP